MSESAFSSPSEVSLPDTASQLRILHCMRAPVGGLFRHVYDLAIAQADAGHAVGIIADKTAADALTIARLTAIMPKLTLGLHLVPMPRQPGIADVSASVTVNKLVGQLNPDVLHGHGAKGGTYARLAASLSKIRGTGPAVFYTPHGGSLHYKPGTMSGTVFLSAEKILRRLTDGLIFESAYAEGIFNDRIGARDVPVRVIPNGLKPEEFEPCPPNADAADFLFVGELRKLKGVSVLLEALERLNASQRVTAVLVGAGPDADTFHAEAATRGLGDVVTFPGALPARDAFRLGKHLVVPSLAESFPYIVLEAGAAGMPLISTNVGGIPEIIGDTDNPLIAPADVDALVKALSEKLENPTRAHAQAEELRRRIAERFTVSVMAGDISAFYEDVRAPA